jgi:uncharacterized protein
MNFLRLKSVCCAVAVAACGTLGTARVSSSRDANVTRSENAATHPYVVLLKRGAKWLPNKTVLEQPLSDHGRYLNEQFAKGSLQFAGPFLDDTGGLIVYNAADEAEVRAIAEHDPGIVNQILEVESVHPFWLAFDASAGKSPFKSAK